MPSTKIERTEPVHAREVIELLKLLGAHQVKLRLLGGQRDHVVVVWIDRVVHVEGFAFREDVGHGLVLLEQGLIEESDEMLALGVRCDKDGSAL